MVTQGPTHVSRIYMRATPDEIWDALVDPHLTRLYFYDADVECAAWKPGEHYRYMQVGLPIVEGTVLEVDEPHRLVCSFQARWDEGVAGDPPSRITWEINPQPNGVCEVRVLNDGFFGVTPTFNRVSSGMTFLLSGLKTVVETGQPMVAG